MKYTLPILFSIALLGAPVLTRATEAATAVEAGALIPTVSDITKKADDKVGKTIVFEGFVTGVCRNGGKKAFIHDRNREVPATLRVDRTNNIRSFEPGIVGKTVRVTGILRELRIDAAYLDSWEAKTKGVPLPESAKKSTTTDHCTEACGATETQKATLKRITSLRERLSKAQRGYLSSYWVDGIAWELVEKKG